MPIVCSWGNPDDLFSFADSGFADRLSCSTLQSPSALGSAFRNIAFWADKIIVNSANLDAAAFSFGSPTCWKSRPWTSSSASRASTLPFAFRATPSPAFSSGHFLVFRRSTTCSVFQDLERCPRVLWGKEEERLLRESRRGRLSTLQVWPECAFTRCDADAHSRSSTRRRQTSTSPSSRSCRRSGPHLQLGQLGVPRDCHSVTGALNRPTSRLTFRKRAKMACKIKGLSGP